MFGQDILKVFGNSPIKPIQHHMQTICDCVSELNDFTESLLTENWNQVKISNERIIQLEADADNLKKDIRLHMPSSMFMAINRTELLGLLSTQDKIASKAKHIASTIISRKMTIPKEIQDDFKKLVAGCIETTKKANTVVKELDELIETGFKGQEAKTVENMILELDDLERATDLIQLEVRSQLFLIENNISPIEIIFLYKIVDWLGDLADRAQGVGHRLEALLSGR